jgi:HEAT repeat protein
MGRAARPALPALAAALNDSSDGVRRWAAAALGSIGPEARGSLPELRRLYAGAEGRDHAVIGLAIKKIEGVA